MWELRDGGRMVGAMHGAGRVRSTDRKNGLGLRDYAIMVMESI